MTPPRCPSCGEVYPPEARFCPWCGAPIAAEGDRRLPLAQRLAAALGADYSVLGELGRGGFAVVFTVRDKRLNRYLAVKVMRPELVVARIVRERFQREAELVAQLEHPHILPVLFAGANAGLLYFAMPRVQGETLQRRLERDGPLDIETARRVFRELAQGLDYAHERNVVHRDVKPANVLLDRAGKALLVDFGIAKGLSKDGGTLSLTGAVIGTPEYMSPEQAAGSRGLDHRSDIYSLGVVAFEMLAGTLPFSGEVFDIARKQATSVAPNVRHFRPDVPPTLAEVIARCLERERDRRWAGVSDAARSV